MPSTIGIVASAYEAPAGGGPEVTVTFNGSDFPTGWTKIAWNDINVTGGVGESAGDWSLYKWDTPLSSNVCYAEFDVITGDQVAITLCSDGTWPFPWPNGYTGFTNGGYFDIISSGEGTLASVDNSGGGSITGERFRIEHQGGGVIKLFRDGVQMASATASSVKTDLYVVMGFASGGAGRQIDNFEAGAL